MRDYLLFGILVALVPLSFYRPRIGIYAWFWVAFMNPHRLTWGPMYHFPVAQLLGLATLLGAVARRAIGVPPKGALLPLLAAFCLVLTMSTLLAVYPDLAWRKWQDVMKVMLMTLLTMFLITSRDQLRGLLLVIVLSVGFFAVKAIPWMIRSGGQYMIRGPEGSSIASNNDIAMAFNLVLPIALFLSRSEARWYFRWGLRIVTIASAAGVFLSYSRGAFLGICAVGLMILLRSPGRIRTIILIVLVAGMAGLFLPAKWQSRMQTIETYQEDKSAMGRIHTWKFAWDLALDRPFFGGGFQVFRSNPLSFDAHSNYFGVLAEQGFVGLGIYLLLLACSFVALDRIRRKTRTKPQFLWYHDCAGALQASMVGYLVNGLTLGQQYMDLYYVLIAAVAILESSLRSEETSTGSSDVTPATLLAPKPQPLAGRN